MTRSEVCTLVIDTLASVEETIGAPPRVISEDTKPVGELPMFDSILAEDTTVEIFQRLGLKADIDENPFITDRQARTVGQVVDRLCTLLGGGAST